MIGYSNRFQNSPDEEKDEDKGMGLSYEEVKIAREQYPIIEAIVRLEDESCAALVVAGIDYTIAKKVMLEIRREILEDNSREESPTR